MVDCPHIQTYAEDTCVTHLEPLKEYVNFAFFIGGSVEKDDFRFLWQSNNSV